MLAWRLILILISVADCWEPEESRHVRLQLKNEFTEKPIPVIPPNQPNLEAYADEYDVYASPATSRVNYYLPNQKIPQTNIDNYYGFPQTPAKKRPRHPQWKRIKRPTKSRTALFRAGMGGNLDDDDSHENLSPRTTNWPMRRHRPMTKTTVFRPDIEAYSKESYADGSQIGADDNDGTLKQEDVDGPSMRADDVVPPPRKELSQEEPTMLQPIMTTVQRPLVKPKKPKNKKVSRIPLTPVPYFPKHPKKIAEPMRTSLDKGRLILGNLIKYSKKHGETEAADVSGESEFAHISGAGSERGPNWYSFETSHKSDSEIVDNTDESLTSNGPRMSSGASSKETSEKIRRKRARRECTACPLDMIRKYTNKGIPWICGAYQRARRTFKSVCMMRYRNCQDGTMFVKISDYKCEDNPAHKQGMTWFYVYKL